MIRRLSEFIVHTSESPGRFVLALLLGMPTLFLVLFPIMHAFRELAGGAMPFDWQDGLAPEDVYAQLPRYTDTIRELYLAHAFVDTLFPVFVAAFFGSLAAYALRHGVPRAYGALRRYGVFALFFFSVPFDWVENAASLAVIYGYPTHYPDLARLLVAAKHVKLFAEPLIPGATAVCLAVGAVGWVLRRVRRTGS
jgi:hypothetical protein